MAKKEQYLVISNKDTDPSLSLGEAIRETTVVCSTFASAYRLALTLGGVSKPAIKYRKALETMKARQFVLIHQEEEPLVARVSVFKIKSF